MHCPFNTAHHPLTNTGTPQIKLSRTIIDKLSYLDGNTVLIDPTTIYPKGGRMKFNGTFGNCDNVMLFSGTMDGLKNFAYESSASWGHITNYSAGNALNVRCVKVQ